MEEHNRLSPSFTETGGMNPADMLEPAVLMLSRQHVVSKSAAGIPLYETSRDVTSIPQPNSSIMFDRVEETNIAEADGKDPEQQQKRQLFYLAHPAGAQSQKDTPAYYITSVSREQAIGNISLRPSKSRLKRQEFEAVLSAGRSAADKPLFDDESSRVIFSIRPKILGGYYTWLDSDGRQLAVEEQKEGQRILDITAPMQRETRDALVATWCLKLWHDTAESPQAKKDALERLTPAEGMLGYGNMSKAGKRVGALGSLAGAG